MIVVSSTSGLWLSLIFQEEYEESVLSSSKSSPKTPVKTPSPQVHATNILWYSKYKYNLIYSGNRYSFLLESPSTAPPASQATCCICQWDWWSEWCVSFARGLLRNISEHILKRGQFFWLSFFFYFFFLLSALNRIRTAHIILRKVELSFIFDF